MNLAEALEPTSHDVRFHFIDEGITETLGDVWKRGEAVAAWSGYPARPMAAVLSNTSSCIAVLLGAIRCGVELISIPSPPRGADLDWYSEFVRQSCIQRGADQIILDATLIPHLPELPGITYSSYDHVLSTSGPAQIDSTLFQLVQYTSGSTSDPRGVVLGQAQILTNIQSILDRVEPEPGDGACSWLPLSHDMGLIGMLLSAVAAATSHTNGGDIAILTPEGFLRDSSRWLQVCSDFKSTITAAPNFGFEMALRRRAGDAIDLSSLRVCITGAEPVHATTLESFDDRFASVGLNAQSLCPAYGLAEATLAVTMNDPDKQWKSILIDPDDLMNGILTRRPDGMRIVGAGSSLDNIEISIDRGDSDVGEILIKGNSVLDTYSDGVSPLNDGWFRTSDLGFFDDSELYVVGRKDDVLFVAGRKIFAIDVEHHVGHTPGVRVGRVVALTSEERGLMVLLEAEKGGPESTNDIATLASTVRQRVTSRTGVFPRSIGVVAAGRLPMTASGKNRRRAAQISIADGTLEVLQGSIGFDGA